MMPPIESRTPFSVQNPRRSVKRTSSKIIFLSLEGSVTEEEYFRVIQDIFSQIKTKIQFISVAEDAVNTSPKYRTSEQNILLSRNRPKQLAERIAEFKRQKEADYQFSKYPEDEFWIVSDVDENWQKILTLKISGKRSNAHSLYIKTGMIFALSILQQQYI